jgi:hypothetical protein
MAQRQSDVEARVRCLELAIGLCENGYIRDIPTTAQDLMKIIGLDVTDPQLKASMFQPKGPKQ